MSDTVHVSEYADLARNGSISDREIEAVVNALDVCAGEKADVFVLDEWIVDEKDLKSVPGASRVFVAVVERETDKAWLLEQNQRDSVWVPKSCSIRYTADEGVVIETPQIGLGNFEAKDDHLSAEEVAR